MKWTPAIKVREIARFLKEAMENQWNKLASRMSKKVEGEDT